LSIGQIDVVVVNRPPDRPRAAPPRSAPPPAPPARTSTLLERFGLTP
jgi:hypothetical protein